ncbi:MAG: phosphopantetheine adenylyltransferase [Methanophagales archaeon]|nr:phosphopantetheine adenylyltransferase [Methanophagales archaeon]MCW3141816.1 phosphopantetheine adenylyltransferase [Methanophagales archaeon]
MKVAIGGTFDPLHDGHKKLLKKVYELSEGDEIVIGVTSDRMARANKNREVLPYNVRAENLSQYMYEEYGVKIRTVELNDRYGVTLDEDFDYIVISPETYEVALEINRLRKERGKRPIKIVKVEHAKAANGKTISSTRIKAGEIDEHGSLLAHNKKFFNTR